VLLPRQLGQALLLARMVLVLPLWLVSGPVGWSV